MAMKEKILFVTRVMAGFGDVACAIALNKKANVKDRMPDAEFINIITIGKCTRKPIS